MGFYIRKAFSFGPVRLNLSKSGLGVSFGVTGLRVGAGPKGPYVHGGRHGLYYRKYLGGSGAASGSGRSAPAPKVEKLTRMDAFAGAQVHRSALDAAAEQPRLSPWWILLPPVYAGLWLLRDRRMKEAESHGARLIELASSPDFPDEECLREMASLRESTALPSRWLPWVYESLFERAAASVVEDRIVDDREAAWLSALERALEVPPERAAAIKTTWYKALYMEAVSDHVLTEEEERELTGLRESLGIPAAEIESELSTLERLASVREIMAGRPAPVQCSFPLASGETCYLEAPGRVLKQRVLSRFQRQGVKHKELGMVCEREGTLVITDRKIMVVGDGTASIPLGKVLDVEVDTDLNLISVTRSDRKKPVYLSTTESMVAGAIMGRLVENP